MKTCHRSSPTSRGRSKLHRATAVVLATTLFWTNPVHAGFLQDFYTSAGGSVNMTPAQAYTSQAGSVITGGSLVFRAAQKNFQPFSFTPPSLKAGCGGISLFAGALGFPSKDEFVATLRSIGQNAAGLAFKVALSAMAPELESKMQEVSDYVNKLNQHFGNSCEMAKRLMDSGPNRWITEAVQTAKLNMTATGASQNYGDAWYDIGTDGAKALNNAPTLSNSGGQVVDAAELNILWSALGSGDMGLSTSEKELFMALVGTTVYKRQEGGTDTKILAIPFPPQITLDELVGKVNDTAIPLPVYKCMDAGYTNRCLDLAGRTVSEKPFAALVYGKALGLRDAIVNKTPPSRDDMRLLSVTTSIPLYKIIQFTALPSRAWLSDSLLEMYSTAVAWEIASHYIEESAANVEKMLRTSQDTEGRALKREALQEVRQRLQDMRVNAGQQRRQLYEKITQQGALVAQIEHIERSLYSGLSSQLAANARFGR